MAKDDADEKELKKAAAEKPDVVEIDPSDKDDDDDDDKPAPGKVELSPEQKASRRERRQERKKIHDALEEERASRARIEREFQEHRARTDREIAIMRAERLAEKAPKPEDAMEVELRGVESEEDTLLLKWRSLSEEQQVAQRDEYTKQMRAVERKKVAVIAKHSMPQPQQQQRQQSGTEVMLRTEYPMLFQQQNAQAMRWAEVRYEQILLENGLDNRQHHPHLSKQAAQEAVERFNLGGNGHSNNGRRQASDVDARRHISSGKGSRDGGGAAPRTVVMTKEFKQMADAAYSHIKDPKERYAQWARDVEPESLEN